MTVYLDDGDVRLYHGDAASVLAGLPAGIAQTCVTSPPYWGLRDYGVDDQLGLEASPALYVQRLVAVMREVRRVLRDDGTLWLNLGDSYAGGGYANHKINGEEWYDAATLDKRRDRQQKLKKAVAPLGLKPKDLVGIPWRVAFALQADGWYLRSDIIWSKPNPMPESVTDRPTKAHEYLFLLSKQPRYYYDADAIREPHHPDGRTKTIHDHATPNSHPNYDNVGNGNERWPNGGRNARSVWEIPTQPFPEAHFATYPEELVRRCVLAGTSERGECSECGQAWQRVAGVRQLDLSRPQARRAQEIADAAGLTAEHIEAIRSVGIADTGKALVTTNGAGHNTDRAQALAREAQNALGGYYREFLLARPTTDGWAADGACSAPARPQLVLDPFVGSGTTALVARKHGRRCIGIDLSSAYLDIAARRTRQLSLLAQESL